jgi:hypothetical protein
VPAAQKSVLVSALSACADGSQQRDARRFLQGLAKDELQYIAEFLGSCILESQGYYVGSRTQLVEAIKQFDRSRRATCGASPSAASIVQDQEHKMILLLEYLCRSGLTRFSMGVGA